jgi:L-asparaginase/Glu-tRNA(Gln) amidotransferase subunit D
MIAQGMTTSFKEEILEGVHDLTTDVLKIALYSAQANLNADTTIYSTDDEISDVNYTAGGEVMTGVTVAKSDTTAYVGFSNVTWIPAGFIARGALIYNSSKGNKSIAVLDFGSDIYGNPNFTVQMPVATASDALLRIV